MGMFDDMARQMAKSAPAPFHAWAHSHQQSPPPLAFDRWDDARRVPFPGGPDRTDDLVAILRRSDNPNAPPVHQIIEVQLALEPTLHHRVGVYELLLPAEKVTAGERRRRSVLIEEWKRVVMLEQDVERRRFCRDAALVFAELTRGLVNWQRGLEGFEMVESQYIKGFIEKGVQQGIVEARRADLLELLRGRFQDPVPDSVRLAVEGTNDPATLNRWFKTAVTANSLAEFRAAMPLDR